MIEIYPCITHVFTYMYVCLHMHRYNYRYGYTPYVPGVSFPLYSPEEGRASLIFSSCSELLSGCVKPLVVYVMLFDPHSNPLRGEAWGPFSPCDRQGNSCVFLQPGAWRVEVLHFSVLLPLSRKLLSRLCLLLSPGGSATT